MNRPCRVCLMVPDVADKYGIDIISPSKNRSMLFITFMRHHLAPGCGPPREREGNMEQRKSPFRCGRCRCLSTHRLYPLCCSRLITYSIIDCCFISYFDDKIKGLMNLPSPLVTEPGTAARGRRGNSRLQAAVIQGLTRNRASPDSTSEPLALSPTPPYPCCHLLN
jgi:hypothetical protein